MNGLDSLPLSDQTSLWMFNVLIQVTILTSLALLIALLFRTRAAMRYWVLCFGLILVFSSPVIALLIQSTGGGLFTLQSNHDQVSMASAANLPAEKQFLGEPEALGQLEILQDPAEPIDVAHGKSLKAEAIPQNAHNNHPRIDRNRAAELPEAFSGQSAPTTRQSWLVFAVKSATAVFASVWAVGAIFLLARMLFNWIRMARILREAQPITDEKLQLAFDRACLAAGCDRADRRSPVLVSSSNISGPMAAGVFRGAVVLPESLIGQVSAEKLIDVLVHEVAHVVRRDQIIVLVQNAVAAIFWMHPLVRKLNRELARAREEVCDNFVLSATTAPTYSRTLLELAQLVVRHEPLPGCVGFFTSRWKLEDRVAGLLDANRDRATLLGGRGRMFMGLTVVALSSLMWMGTVKFARAQSEATIQAETVTDNVADQSSDEASPRNVIPPFVLNSPMVEVSGVVVDEDETPVESATVSIFINGRRSFKTNAAGEFKFQAPERLIGDALLLAANSDQSMQTSHRIPFVVPPKPAVLWGQWPYQPKDYQSLKLKLTPSRSFVVQVKDQAGRSVPDATVGCTTFETRVYTIFALSGVDKDGRVTMRFPSNLDVDNLFAVSQSAGVDYRSYIIGGEEWDDNNAKEPEQPRGVVELTLAKGAPITITVKDTKGHPVADATVFPEALRKHDQSACLPSFYCSEPFSSSTNENGVATFEWIPEWAKKLTFHTYSDGHTSEKLDTEPNPDKRDFEITVARKVLVKGRVKLADGSPARGLEFHHSGLGRSFLSESAFTGDDGEFEIEIARGLDYLFTPASEKLKFDSPVEFKEGDTHLDLTVQPGIRVFGKVTKKLFGSEAYEPVYFRRKPKKIGFGDRFNYGGDLSRIRPNGRGEFEFFVGPGKHHVFTRDSSWSFAELTITDQKEVEVHFDSEFSPYAN